MKQFELSQEFIELNKLLKLMQWAESGGHANQLIENGEIKVNGEFEYRKRNKLRAGAVVSFGKLQVELVAATV
jgi:ribosome-associated protein